MNAPGHIAADSPGEPGPDRIFRDALKQGSFRIQRCNACSKHVFYPRVSRNAYCSNEKGQRRGIVTGIIQSTPRLPIKVAAIKLNTLPA